MQNVRPRNNFSKSQFWRLNADAMQIQADSGLGCMIQKLPDIAGYGNSQIFRIDSNLQYIATHYQPVKNLAVLSHIAMPEPRLIVTLGLKGSSRFVPRQGEEIIFKHGYTTITTFNASSGERHYQADRSMLQLRFSLNKHWLDQYFSATCSAGFFNISGLQKISYHQASPHSLAAAQQLIDGKFPAGMRKVYMHGLILTILSAELSPLINERGIDFDRANGRDRVIADNARKILFEEYRDPPSVENLAKRAGTNPYKLKMLFHKYYECTPYGLLLEIRMEKAMHLLKFAKFHVAVVADKVGYRHASNFSTAFMKYYGVSPKTIAKS